MDILMIREIEYPFSIEQIRKLNVGDRVNVSGCIFTARDRVHQYLFARGKAPVVLKSGALYHCGPVVVREKGNWVIRAAGPTTSIREERYIPDIIRRHKIRVIIGKGGMGARTLKACAEYGCVYLHTVGGAAQVLADKVEQVLGVHFLNEFGSTEAMWELRVRNFPAIVTMDMHGHSLHEQVAEMTERNLRRI